MKLLVADDDLELSEILTLTLQKAGFEVIVAYDGVTALQLWRQERPDLVLLDVNLPRLDGFTVLQQIHQESTTPVIMLTVRDEDADVVRGLEAGADDYIGKPFSPRQLVARVRAVLRRSNAEQAKEAADRYSQQGDFYLDNERRMVQVADGPPVQLTALEFRLLAYLLHNVGHVLSPRQLIRQVWGDEAAADRTALKQLVRRLRLKIEPEPGQPRYLQTVAGVGYMLQAESISARQHG